MSSSNNSSFIKINKPMTIIFLPVPIIIGYYFAAILSTTQKNTIYTMISLAKEVYHNPFQWYFNKYTILFIVINLILYAFIVLIAACMHKPTRYGEEQGSSKWESPSRVNKILADLNRSPDDENNIVVYKIKKPNKIKKIYLKWKYRNEN